MKFQSFLLTIMPEIKVSNMNKEQETIKNDKSYLKNNQNQYFQKFLKIKYLKFHLWPCSLGQVINFCSPLDMEIKAPIWFAFCGLEGYTPEQLGGLCIAHLQSRGPHRAAISSANKVCVCTCAHTHTHTHTSTGRLTEEQKWKICQQRKQKIV